MSMRMFLFAVLTFLAVAVQAAESPLIVSDLVTGDASHVRITNSGSQPVTAWSLAATTEPAPGRTHREVYTTDGYLSEVTHGLPRAAERLERLMPGESRDLPLDPLSAGAKVEVIATVLDDRTAIGDEEALRAIFANRKKERDALKSVVDAFNEVLPAMHGAEALSALRDRFRAIVAREDNVPRRARCRAGVPKQGRRRAGRRLAAHVRGFRDPGVPARGEAFRAEALTRQSMADG